MIPVKLSYIAQRLGWRLLGRDQTIDNVVSDSRKVKSGDCFIALYGDNFDAHQFIGQVIELGAKVVIVSKEQQLANDEVSQLVVSDTRTALGELAGLNRQLSKAKFVAITGSCGKTTVKEMIAAILSQRGQVLATAGNFNNEIGVPLTLLRLTTECQYGVIELGANHIGEIDYTSKLVKPDVALITNIGAAHLEGFGSIAGVVEAKSEIFNHLTSEACAIFDDASDYATRWRQLNDWRQVATFSSEVSDKADYFATDINIDDNGKVSFTLNSPSGVANIALALPGLHNVANALAAAAACVGVGATLAEIEFGLGAMNEVAGRLNIIPLSKYLRVIDDTYNANSSSVAAATKLLGQCQGRKILILGDMAELGDYAVKCHQELSPLIEQQRIDLLLTYGKFSQHYASGFTGEHNHFEDKRSLNLYIEQHLDLSRCKNTTTVLVKGSRSAKMEQVVSFISDNAATSESAGGHL